MDKLEIFSQKLGKVMSADSLFAADGVASISQGLFMASWSNGGWNNYSDNWLNSGWNNYSYGWQNSGWNNYSYGWTNSGWNNYSYGWTNSGWDNYSGGGGK